MSATGVSAPFTHSYNLIAALDCSLSAKDWRAHFSRTRRCTSALCTRLKTAGLAVVARDEEAMPGIITVAIPTRIRSVAVGERLAEHGIEVAYLSGYLQARNWLQICLMGALDEAALERIPGTVAGCL